MKRIILALCLILILSSNALCDDNDYEHIRTYFGSDWYLNKYHFVPFRKGDLDMVSCLLTKNLAIFS